MPTLKELSLALGLLGSDPFSTGEIDGWEGYVWRVRGAEACQTKVDGFCHILQDRWDWKRPQFYEVSFKADAHNNVIVSRITLRNEDVGDDDQVCLVVNYLGGEGKEVGVFYANWRSLPGRTYTREAQIKPGHSIGQIRTVAVGSKQCDVVSKKDAANYQRLRTLLHQR